MNMVTNFQENFATLSSDPEITFETGKEPKHFQKLKSTDEEHKN
jgi:hypothetical protein